MKRCPGCNQTKPVEDFAKNRTRPDGLQLWCRDCIALANRKWYAREGQERRKARNGDPAVLEYYRQRHIKRRSGKTKEELRKDCALCGESAVVFMDHDHETGRFRDMLCRACNSGLGLFRDDPELLEAAAAYLRLHKSEAI